MAGVAKNDSTGRTSQLAEATVTIGSTTHFPKKNDAWDGVERRYLQPDCIQNKIGRVTFSELVENYRKKAFDKLSFTTQAITAHIFDDHLLPRWGDDFALDIEPDEIEEWLHALELGNPTKEKIRRLRFGLLKEHNIGISVAADQTQFAAVGRPVKVPDLL